MLVRFVSFMWSLFALLAQLYAWLLLFFMYIYMYILSSLDSKKSTQVKMNMVSISVANGKHQWVASKINSWNLISCVVLAFSNEFHLRFCIYAPASCQWAKSETNSNAIYTQIYETLLHREKKTTRTNSRTNFTWPDQCAKNEFGTKYSQTNRRAVAIFWIPLNNTTFSQTIVPTQVFFSRNLIQKKKLNYINN